MVVNTEGRCLGEGMASYHPTSLYPGWAEEDPEEVFVRVLQAVRGAVECAGVSPRDIQALSFGASLHSLLAVDRYGHPLIPAMIWADTRSRECSLRIRQYCDERELYHRTGCPVHPLYPVSKILWLREHRPQVYQEAHKYLSIKEFVLHRLLNRYVVDRSVASATGLFNIHTLDWDPEVLRMVGITSERLSEHVAATTVLQGVEPQYARAMGVPSDLLVVVGAGDGLLCHLGTGCVHPGQMSCTIGSSGALRMFFHQPRLDERGRTWCYLFTDETWAVGGATNDAGLAYQWFRQRLYGETVDQASLDESVDQVGPGAGGLIFLPFLSGGRSPYWNPDARGVLFGLSLHHDRPHLLRAVMEGVGLAMYSVLLSLKEVAGEIVEIRGSGGFLHSPLWVQVLADVLGMDILVPPVIEATSLGAVFLAMYALGYMNELSEARARVEIVQRYASNRQNHGFYLHLFEIYQGLYRALEAQFAPMQELQAEMIRAEGESPGGKSPDEVWAGTGPRHRKRR